MLTQLSVKNHALVERLEIDFHAGLTAITGETGAGKSILLSALGLTLGDRADFDQVRAGADRAEIHASFDISKLSGAKAFLEDQMLEADGECLLRRVINTSGTSKAWINGQPVTLTILKDLAELLISIHSQHEHQCLLKPDYQRDILDAFGHLEQLVASTATSYHLWHKKAAALRELKEGLDEQMQRRELLGYQVQELSDLALQTGEFADLEQEQKQLANAEQILKTLYQANNVLSEEDDFNALNAVRQTLQLAQSVDIANKDFDECLELLDSSLTQLEEARDSLRRVSDSVELNPERLLEVEERISAAFELARKHRCEPSELPGLADNLTSELNQLSGLDANLESLEEEVAALEKEYLDKANQLSSGRKKAASELAAAVKSHFSELNMEGAELNIQLNTTAPSVQGLEKCEFLIRTNPGQEHKPLARIASGGELSRVSLAIQVVTAQTSETPTLIFDEVDVGIGGATANVVGQKLRQLSGNAQVVCVTHLAQVASNAHHQLNVVKQTNDGMTQTHIFPLDDASRKTEIARMLSGDTRSEHSLKHAEELLSSARA